MQLGGLELSSLTKCGWRIQMQVDKIYLFSHSKKVLIPKSAPIFQAQKMARKMTEMRELVISLENRIANNGQTIYKNTLVGFFDHSKNFEKVAKIFGDQGDKEERRLSS